MNNEISEYNGIKYCHVEMTKGRIMRSVAVFASKFLNDDEFQTFIKLEVHKKYDELIEYDKLYNRLVSLGINAEKICDFINDLYENIGEIIEPV